MDSKTRIELIRKGNEAFNEKDYAKARDLFTEARYSDGLIRLGDHYMYERRLPLLAYGYYRRAGATDKINDLHRRMVSAIGAWIGKDKIKPEFQGEAQPSSASGRPTAPSAPAATHYVDTDTDGMVRVPVNNLLLQQARQILDGNR